MLATTSESEITTAHLLAWMEPTLQESTASFAIPAASPAPPAPHAIPATLENTSMTTASASSVPQFAAHAPQLLYARAASMATIFGPTISAVIPVRGEPILMHWESVSLASTTALHAQAQQPAIHVTPPTTTEPW